ncbi:Pectinesterase inhibitor domain [Arabidopsis thaliana x Arabidopsis arenosa]|uniref:Pectinesterase inhibitor domain n=1 Tax=Arabidopsis thaliana x Arabidopsis arenosa TaxID=1240361 RepID=A0A8T1YA49_9BRAS|nr:Pectinesterase inhibitor domain [Arabidopsis thaliana x Arabidopsis arenosa]
MATSFVLSTFAATAITLQLLLSSASASPHMKYIDAICDRAHDQAFCVKTLTTNPPTAAPIGLLPLSEAVINLATSHAEKTAIFVDETAKKDPTVKTAFTECHKAYLAVAADLKSANVKLKASPDTANYDVRASSDNMRRVNELVGKNTDKASTTLKEMTVQMEKLLDLAAGAADAVDDDDENIRLRV